MSAEEIWHAQMEAGGRGDWDIVPGNFAPDSIWTLMPPGTAFRRPAEIVTFTHSGFGAAAEREEADVRNEFATNECGALGYTSRDAIDAQRAAGSPVRAED